MEKQQKTNAMLILEDAKIPYRTSSYEVDLNDLSSTHAAEMLGIDPGCMFKTLVTRGTKNGIQVFCIPSEAELNLKQAASLSGDKRVELIAVKELLPLTGYLRGGCSPVGMKKRYPTFIDVSALNYDEIYLSAGQRGRQIIVSPADIASFLKAPFLDLIHH